ncbi:MAG TPA: D-alanyl-D-alanine carboxypeptidase/D-alanyl-D-alanine-endopeptidase [Kofleriaceae bacterium]|nr:D-alanyl-D-alanine carboxypeptidase/D-alanyl-D-alanine-endopeptidase [Kofleriaceae bacterium]
MKSRIAVTLFAAAFGAAAPAGARPAEPAAVAAKPAAKPTRSRTAAISAKPVSRAHPVAVSRPVSAAVASGAHDGAHARVAVAINHADLRPAREVVGRRDEPLTAEEETARQIEGLLRGPLRAGTTGLFVADARTGEALFAVNADDPLNPASNVKMISTATALELLGADFKYPTRVLGATPAAGVVRGDVYLLGSYDPTLTLGDLDQIAAAIAARGVTEIDGGIVVGTDPARDGVFGAAVPIAVRAGATPGAPAIAAAPAGMDLVAIKMAAKTVRAGRPRLTYQVDTSNDAGGAPRVVVTIGGTIGRGAATTYTLPLRDRTAMAAYALRASLRAHGVALAGDIKTAELERFVATASAAGDLPIELGRHDSLRLAEIVAKVNKWSINWLADRVIMTAAALTKHQPPTMELALAAMYDWLGRHPHIAKDDLLVDTGSGLSYRTRITPHELVSIVRSAAGFDAKLAGDPDASVSHAWLDSLSIAGTDGTLASRFRGDMRGRIRGKTGTLSNAIALSGVLDIDPDRPLAFSLVTNGSTPLSARFIRRAHEQVIGVISRYLRKTAKAPSALAPAAPVLPPANPAAVSSPLPGDPEHEIQHQIERSESSDSPPVESSELDDGF